MLSKIRFFSLITLFMMSSNSWAHDNHGGEATYLANEGVMISSAGHKILFDPFFHNDYNNYQLVPEDIVKALMANQAPYNDIDAVFISHAHGDHFAADDMVKYMGLNKSVKLIAPDQAIEAMTKLEGYEAIKNRITSIQLEYKDAPQTFEVDGLSIDALRIPHAGWPGRADVSNIVYRVVLTSDDPKNPSDTVIHMGDADPNDEHFRPYKELWMAKKTQVAFPPFWFFLSAEGRDILDTRINTEKSVGVHVPVNVPQNLKDTGKDYFSKPGETRALKTEQN
ncbi:MBL fold metallo-hydrolase [Alteromonadaceae bacterium M269]|nr:MBL fold metallo-hydrolase [Alteromonadaceae bacterium M269]